MKPFEFQPIKVVYNQAGFRWILNWYSDQERGHLIIAKSKEEAERIFKDVCDKHVGLAIREFTHIELVAPSDRLNEIHNRNFWQMKFEDFSYRVRSRAQDMFNSLGEYPAGFGKCQEYQPRESLGDPTRWGEEDVAYYTNRHYLCQNCDAKIQIRNLEGMFLNAFEKIPDFEKELYQREGVTVKDNLKPSLAEKALDTDILFVANTDSLGPHGHGITLVQMTDVELLPQTCGFFYRKIGNVDKTVVNEILMESVRARLQHLEEISEKNRQETERDARRRANIIRDFFQNLQ